MQAKNQGKSKEHEMVELRVFGSERDEKLSRDIEEIRSKIVTHTHIYIYRNLIKFDRLRCIKELSSFKMRLLVVKPGIEDQTTEFFTKKLNGSR